MLQSNICYTSPYANIDIHEKRSSPEIPSLGVFFDGGLLYNGSVYFTPFNLKDCRASVVFGFIYEHATLSATSDGIDMLGRELSIDNKGLSIGAWFKPSMEVSNFLLMLNVGYIFKSYAGTSNLNNDLSLKPEYTDVSAIRLEAGCMYLNPSAVPVSFQLLFSYDFGTVTRGEIKYYSGGKYIGKLIPTGDLVLPGNFFTLRLGLSYPLYL